MVKTFSEKDLQKFFRDCSPEELVRRLKQWRRDPNSQPEIEYWYRNYQLPGKTFLPRLPEQWEIEAKQYIPRLDEAMALEKAGYTEKALEIYLDIIDQYEPSGTTYYERPAIILERSKQIERAILVCEKALNNLYLMRSWDDFDKRLNRLKNKLIKKAKST